MGSFKLHCLDIRMHDCMCGWGKAVYGIMVVDFANSVVLYVHAHMKRCR